VAAQCDHPPENLVRLLKPNGILVCPVGPVVPIDSKHPGRFQPYWMVKMGPVAGAAPAFSGRAGPISVNFLPLLPP
ncbi:PCMT1, partial [Symbiodinium microadriaticum]